MGVARERIVIEVMNTDEISLGRVWSKMERSLGLRFEEPHSSGVREKKIKLAKMKKEWPPPQKI